MDGDLGAFLQSVLSDPEQMEKITQMAQGLMGQARSPDPAPAPQEEPRAAPMGETRLLSILSKAMASGAGKGRSTALLTAMRPYMRPEKQEKLDRAMKIARMVNVARTVMGEYGGGGGL